MRRPQIWLPAAIAAACITAGALAGAAFSLIVQLHERIITNRETDDD